MNLHDLLTACESGFSEVKSDKKAQGIELSSGGNDVPGDAQLRTEPACLYATEALAYAAWLAEFNRSIDRTGILVWVERPYVETYRITLGDEYNSYRVVRDRYVVRGIVAVEPAIEADVPLPDEVLFPRKLDPAVTFAASEFKEVKVKRKARVA